MNDVSSSFIRFSYLLAISLCLGCGDTAKYDAAQQEAANAPATPQPKPSEADAPSADEPPETERVKAGVGVGKKGRSLDGYTDGVEGAIASPAQAYFSTKEKLTFEIQLKHAMDLYKATNGRLPNSHEAFMNEIVKFNKINLPELPAGHKYVFDPERGELMVERPKS